MGPLLVRRRVGRLGGHELCLLRGNARHSLGEHVPSRALLVLWSCRVRHHWNRNGRLPPVCRVYALLLRRCRAFNPSARFFSLLPQLHLYPTLLHRLSPYLHLLSDSASNRSIQKDCHSLPDPYHGHLVPLCFPRCAGPSRERYSANS